jgi:hypothetical protein
MIKTIQISDELFWGFNTQVNIDTFQNFEELAIFIKVCLISFLKTHNLLNLVEKANSLQLHNHNFQHFHDIYKTDDEIIYLCGGCRL